MNGAHTAALKRVKINIMKCRCSGKKGVLRQITLLFQMFLLLYSQGPISPFGPEQDTIQRIQRTLFMTYQKLSIQLTSRVLCLHKHRALFTLQTVFIMVHVLKQKCI